LFDRIRRRGRSSPPGDGAQGPTFAGAGLAVWGQTVEFLQEPRFREAFAAGDATGHGYGNAGLEWRVAVCCWAGAHASRLAGDFVECGVHTGMFSLAVCHYAAFNDTGKRFWLFDTFSGIPDEQISPVEAALGRDGYQAVYSDTFEVARANFAGFPRVELVRGIVPASLDTVTIDEVAYLSLDMNTAHPERAALEHFWPKLVPGAVVVLDDYGWETHLPQKRALDEVARARGVEILPLPTGQGLLLKP
jgi:hypothetical protein